MALGCGLWLLAGCTSAALPTAPYHTLAVAAMPGPPPWPKPDPQRTMTNLEKANVPFMMAPHDSAPMHMHVKLEIFYNGRPVTVPAEIGMIGGMMGELHTHDDWGFIHIEGARYRPYSLGQFFDVWGVPLAGARIYKDGKPVPDAYKTILADEQTYRIYYNTPNRR
jgi:hypothetical protein